MSQNPAMQGGEEIVTSISVAKARRFLEALKDNPFVAIVIEDDKVHFYSKGVLTQEQVDHIRDALSDIEGEEDDNQN